MNFEQIDRPRYKWEAAELLRTAQVSPKGMTALYLGLVLVLNLISSLGGKNFMSIFINILATLLTAVLAAGFTLYCMAIRRGERAEFLTLFDGFAFVGKLILLEIVMSLFIVLWSMLFVIPGIVAAYRYSFALYNLYENPGIGVMEALDMSKRQTYGYKGQLFLLDLSYFGWTLLAALPTYVFLMMVNRHYAEYIIYDIAMPDNFFGIPLLALDLLFGLWRIAVSMFYLPNLICVQLAYFETAKRTSGVGFGAPPAWDGWNAPDGLS